ncbi:hypothetical protein [Lysobacter capsici]|uniref:hypothetical protein n=1 Tax=Lysobacter capsici TaxID=435897 RepID=UPI000716445E|nr:hypothetical protein [Lysobacter capsici]
MKTKIITEAGVLFEALEGLFEQAGRIDMSVAWVSSGQGQGRHWKASRLLSVKRPDVFVSVNNGSKPKLARLIGGKRIDTVKQYLALLDRIWSTKWYGASEPEDEHSASIWCCRAALLDSALYERV